MMSFKVTRVLRRQVTCTIAAPQRALIRARLIGMAAAFSEPTLRQQRDSQQEFEIRIQGSSTQLFQHWLASSTDEAVWTYFQSVCDGLAARELEHYHFKILNGQFNRHTRSQNNEWHIQIFYGGNIDKEGPLQVCTLHLYCLSLAKD